MARKQAEVITSHGMIHDSTAEKDILSWFMELKELGYIASVERGETFTLSESVERTWVQKLKTKTKCLTETLLQPCTYTYDFKVTLNGNSYKLPIFKDFNNHDKLNKLGESTFLAQGEIVRLEVKGTALFRYNNSGTEKFAVLQKWLFQSQGLYVNLIQPDKLFPRTFTPKEYQLTPKKKEVRKLKWKPINVEDYIKQYE